MNCFGAALEETMKKLKLTYFDMSAGRAEPIRLALKLGGIEFEDDRFEMSEFSAIKSKMPLGQVPVLAINDEVVTQTNSLLRYVGKLANLYPTDDFSALRCDEILSALEDTTAKVVATFGLQGDALEEARIKFTEGPLTLSLTWLEEKLATGRGEYFIDDRLSVADLKVFVWLRVLNAGVLDHVPSNIVAKIAPTLNAHGESLLTNPVIKAHYQTAS